MKQRAVMIVLFLVGAASPPAWADVGVRAGGRGGIELHENDAPVAGADMRLSFSLSPLTVNPIFDYYFDEDTTIFQVGVNALYYLPFPTELLVPYVGPGVGVTRFAYGDDIPSGDPDDVPTNDGEGYRVGLNLVGGVCFDLPLLAPFAQTMVTIGDVDLFSVSGGLLFAFGGNERWDACGRRRGGTEAGGTP